MGGTLRLASGVTLGRYELVLRVAAGGMGEVWAARLKREHGFQKIFALKILRPGLAADPELVRMFLEEANIASRIRHPNVVPVVDVGEDRGTLFLVMEWVSGEPLAAAIRGAAGRPASPLVAARIAYQICAGLEAAHELCDDEDRPLNLVHFDVSPENVLITSEGLVRLIDFGVARPAGGPSTWPPGGVSPPSRSVEVRGKAPYMAPEHILGALSDRRADLFAVGVLLYELLSGCHPFLADDDRITMTRIASLEPVEPVSSRSRPKRRLSTPPSSPVSPELEKVVATALAKSPAERYANAAALMAALEEAEPGAALQGNDAVVAQWLREVLGNTLQVRSGKLREALEAMERGLPEDTLVSRTGITNGTGIANGSGNGHGIGNGIGNGNAIGNGVGHGAGPGSRRRDLFARGARTGAAAVIAAAACALFGTAAAGDSPLAPPEVDREPPSSRDGVAPQRAARGSAEGRLRTARPAAPPPVATSPAPPPGPAPIPSAAPAPRRSPSQPQAVEFTPGGL